MISENKISQFIALLISETQENKITWDTPITRTLDSLEGEQILIGKIYESEFKDKWLRLYKYTEPIQVEEFQFHKQSFIKLEFIDGHDRSVWAFPRYIRELYDLYETVQIKSAGIDLFFDDIIPDEPTRF